jgi:hypothetical protein
MSINLSDVFGTVARTIPVPCRKADYRWAKELAVGGARSE